MASWRMSSIAAVRFNGLLVTVFIACRAADRSVAAPSSFTSRTEAIQMRVPKLKSNKNTIIQQFWRIRVIFGDPFRLLYRSDKQQDVGDFC